MAKVVFIGAGSFGFTRKVFRDLMNFETLSGAEIGLVDINQDRLDMANESCSKILKEGNFNATITTSTDRREILKDADAVIITILQGDTSVWQHDILIPKKYGVDINVGDTRGVAGVFRALRTIPVMLNICKDMEELCPKALVLNYTNPMAILCHAVQRTSSMNFTGLCHSVQGTIGMIAKWLELPADEIDYTCAGLNHLSWYTKLEHKGKDLYPQLKDTVNNNEEVYNEEIVRNEMFKAFDYYVTESSGHNSEYTWWFRKRPELIEKYCKDGTGWNPGEFAYILNEYKKRDNTWLNDFKEWINSPDWDDEEKKQKMMETSHEYASHIINAYLGGEPFKFNGNVKNTGLITNLPNGCCVEVPVLATRGTLEPIYVGDIPLPPLPLTTLTAITEQMAVEASLTGNPKLVYQAIAQDPLTAAVLSLAEIKEMVNEMLEANKNFLPHFKSLKA
ncbi:MAG: alpha-galactosidase [Kiritimatiellae bacterium]|jgi:alpha-galactosidase|nr:alpha-galactosidase [Kiritimatiellia bacterium]